MAFDRLGKEKEEDFTSQIFQRRAGGSRGGVMELHEEGCGRSRTQVLLQVGTHHNFQLLQAIVASVLLHCLFIKKNAEYLRSHQQQRICSRS